MNLVYFIYPMDQAIALAAEYLYLAAPLAAAIFFFRSSPPVRRKMLLFAAIALPLAYILARIAGMLYYNPTPFMESGLPPLIPQEPENGFPSDHTLLSAAVAAVVLFFNRRLGMALIILAAAAGAARVMALVHHPADIIASILIAILAAFVTHLYLTKRT